MTEDAKPITSKVDDLDIDHAMLARSRRRRGRMFLAVGLGVVLLGAGIAFAVWWTEHERVRKLGAAWATFQLCTIGKIPNEQSPEELRYFINMTERVRLAGEPSTGKAPLSDTDLLRCKPYAKTVLDLMDIDPRGTEFRKKVAGFVDTASSAVLNELWAAGQNYHVPIGEMDRSVDPPVTGKPLIEWKPARTLPSGMNVAAPFALAGQRRIATYERGSVAVCDFSADIACATFPLRGADDQYPTAVLSSPPLGDSILLRGSWGLASTRVSGKFTPLPPGAAHAFQAGASEPHFTQSGDKPDTVDVMSFSPTATTKVTTVDIKGLTQVTVRMFWDHLLLIGAESGGDIPADEVWPTLFSISPSGKRTKIARVTNNQDLDDVLACKAGDTTYVSMRDTEEDYARYPDNPPDAWVLTFRGEAATLRKVQKGIPAGERADCDETGLTIPLGKTSLFCPPEGDCKEVPSISWETATECTDKTRRFSIGRIDDAIIFAVAPLADATPWKPVWLIDGRTRDLPPPTVLCVSGHAYGRIGAAVIDLETDPPTFR